MTTTAPPDLDRIGARVRKLRAERGWRQHQLADEADVSLATVQNIEAKEPRRALDSTYGRIARALQIPLSDLLGEEE